MNYPSTQQIISLATLCPFDSPKGYQSPSIGQAKIFTRHHSPPDVPCRAIQTGTTWARWPTASTGAKRRGTWPRVKRLAFRV